MRNQNELCHHGVKGMKWGVQRYKNPDGTLTTKGKKKYANRIDLEHMSRANHHLNNSEVVKKAIRTGKKLSKAQKKTEMESAIRKAQAEIDSKYGPRTYEIATKHIRNRELVRSFVTASCSLALGTFALSGLNR